MTILRGAIICPDQELSASLQSALSESREAAIVRIIPQYTNRVDTIRFLRAAAPDLLFLSVENLPQALAVAEYVAAEAPHIQVAAVHRAVDPQFLLATMRAGIREFLHAPFERASLRETLVRMREQLERRPPSTQHVGSVFAFLPAKAGVGCSTLAVNTGVMLSTMPDTKVLLTDFDLNCGMVGFMLKLDGGHSIVTAAENALEMDENLWPRIVCSRGSLDILPTGKLVPGFRIEPVQIQHLLAFARRNYDAVCADLSGMMEKYSIEILHEAQRIFLVSTPELPSLHLTREKLSFLRSQRLDDRVSILLNRAQQRHVLSQADMEGLFGQKVEMTFPNDYSGVHKALTAGRQVETSSDLGKAVKKLAESLAGAKKAPAASQIKRSLLDVIAPRKKDDVNAGAKLSPV